MSEPASRAECVRVLVVDDDPLVCAGLRLMLRGAGDIEVVGEVGDGAEVPEAVERLRPAVVLMDVRMPTVDGISATRSLTRPGRGGHRPAVIVLTTFDTDATVVDALRSGAAGFLLKNTPPERLVEACRRAAYGEPVLSPSVTRQLIDQVAGGPGEDERARRARERFAQLSDRERDVATAVAEGLSNSEIGGRLYISVGSVKAHLSSALTKLDLANRTQLALLAHDAGEA